MLISVRDPEWETRPPIIVDVEVSDVASAEQAAFRFILRRVPKDYQELATATRVVQAQVLSAETAKALLSMR